MKSVCKKIFQAIKEAQNVLSEHNALSLHKNIKHLPFETIHIADMPSHIRDEILSKVNTSYSHTSIVQPDLIRNEVKHFVRVTPESQLRLDVYFLDGPHCATIDYMYTCDLIELYSYTISKFATKKVNHISITILPTAVKKTMDMETKQILGPENLNSGYTILNAPRTIVIYREEELYKVLLHELLHFYGFDYFELMSSFYIDEIKREFSIKSNKLGLNESYNEALTMVFYAAFYIAVKETECMQNFDDFYIRYKHHYNHITRYAIKMSAKLKIYHRKFFDDMHIERTHVFAYYHGKAALLINKRRFFNFLNKRNFVLGEENIPVYISFYKICLKSHLYSCALKSAIRSFSRNPKYASRFFLNTLRMCNYDLKIVNRKNLKVKN